MTNCRLLSVLGWAVSLAAGGVALVRKYRPTPAPPQPSRGLKTGGDGCSVEAYPVWVFDPYREYGSERGLDLD